MNLKRILILPVLIVSVLTFSAQKADLPPISWSCPMHPDVIETHKGKCPICGMNLAAVRLAYIWSCPVHAVIDESQPGKCPICRRDLVQVTTSLSWTCADRPKVNQLTPGKCADGGEMIARHTARAHGNHNAQHGGSFFMASDNWHHLEGTYPEDGVFRLYVYDDYSKPLAADQMKQVSGTVASKESTIPLKLAADGKYLEAKLDGPAPPVEATAKVKFKAGGPEYRFDFVFSDLSRDNNAASLPAGVPSQMMPIEIPDKTQDIVALLTARNRSIRDLIQKGAFGEIYVPAFQAKDLALALDLRSKDMAAPKRSAVTAAVERVVRLAWQLDAYGDLGDRALIEAAYATFAGSIAELELAFSGLK